MKLFPLEIKDNKIERQQTERITVVAKYNWYYSNNSAEQIDKPVLHTHIRRSKKRLPTPVDWNIHKGDYRIREVQKDQHKDFVYYRNLKLKMLKYMLLPAIIFTVVIVFSVLRMFVVL